MEHTKNYWRKRRGESIILRKNGSIPLPDNWNVLRQSVIERDKVCQECGGIEWLGIHHKDLNRLNNELDNLILLCWDCHMKKHHNNVNHNVTAVIFSRQQMP